MQRHDFPHDIEAPLTRLHPGLPFVVVALAFLGAATAGHAAEPANAIPANDVEVGAMPQRLTNNYAPWREYYLEATHRFGDRKVLYGSVRETERFDQKDNQGILGGYYPLGGRVTANVEASGSTTHKVLPRYWGLAGVDVDLGSGWVTGLGGRRSEYDADTVRMGTAKIERYFGNFVAGYSLYESRLNETGSVPAHRFQLGYFYGDRSRVALAYVTGREAENVGPPQGVVVSQVRSYVLYGQHWFSRSWAVSFEGLYHRQGDYYTRQGVRLGLRSSF